MVKNLPANAGDARELRFDSWVKKIPLEEEMATCSSTLAWKIPWTEKPGGLQFTGSQRVKHDLLTEYAHSTRPDPLISG